jgi:hypothetical protein
MGDRRSPLTLRVVLLCALLIPANAWWITEIEYVRYSDNATTQAIFFNCVTLLLVLMGINALLRRLRPAWVLSQAELAGAYIIAAVASNLAGHDQLQILFTTLTYVFRHSTPETGWADKIVPHIAPHLVVSDKGVIDALYQGSNTLYTWDHIRPWLAPLGWWTLFVMMVAWTMLCLSSLLRKQWDAERLNYPIAEIPIQIITQPGSLTGSPVFWIGAGIGATGQIINLIHALVPSVPGLPIGVQIYTAQTYPWNAAGPLPISSFPFAYGLAFLLPTQLGFSCWFFMLLSRVEMVGAAMMGYTDWGKFPYVQQQGVGAILGVFLAILWAARSHLAAAWREALHPPKTSPGHEPEAMSYRMAVFGALAGTVGMLTFAVTAGMRPATAALYLGILFIIVIVVARMRAELGLPTFELYQVGADQVLQRVSGTAAWTRGDLTVMTLFFFLSRTHRQFPMQTHVDALRLGKKTNTHLPALTIAIVLATGVGAVAAFWAYLHSTYVVGLESAKFRGPAMWAFGNEPWSKLDGWLTSPQQADPGSIMAYAFGTLFTVFLAGMRTRFVWWPFHPAGYLVAGSFGLFRLWLPIFVSWLAKVLILRYGGLKTYQRALPFFIGLVLGEFATGFARTVLDMIFGWHLPPESGIGGL